MKLVPLRQCQSIVSNAMTNQFGQIKVHTNYPLYGYQAKVIHKLHQFKMCNFTQWPPKVYSTQFNLFFFNMIFQYDFSRLYFLNKQVFLQLQLLFFIKLVTKYLTWNNPSALLYYYEQDIMRYMPQYKSFWETRWPRPT